MNRLAFTILFFLLAAGVRGQETLSGPMSGTIFSGEYRVSGNILVEKGMTLTIEAGAVLRFANFTGIIVRGMLVCAGTAQAPVLLTSMNDGSGMDEPDPFDWNGVKIEMGAQGASLQHAVIRYSTFGVSVECQNCTVALKQIEFSHNGYAALSRKGDVVAVWEGSPINWSWPSQQGESAETGARLPAEDKPRAATREKAPRWKIPVIVTCGMAAAGGVAMWIAGHVLAEQYHDDYLNRSDTPETAQYNKEKTGDSVTLRNAGIILAAVGVVGITVTFFF